MGAFCPSRKCEDEAKVWTLGFMALTKEVSDMPIGDVVLCRTSHEDRLEYAQQA